MVKKKPILTKVKSTYAIEHTALVLSVNEETPFQHVSIHEYGDPCSGVLQHWGTPDELIEECEHIIEVLKEYKDK